MLGVNASCPVGERLTGTVFLVNGYWNLANANAVPSSGGQLTYKVNARVTAKQTVLWGPHQSNTSLKYRRFLSDSIVERKGDRSRLRSNTYTQGNALTHRELPRPDDDGPVAGALGLE